MSSSMSQTRPRLLPTSVLLAAILALLTTFLTGSPASAKVPPALYLLQGVPGASVDITIDGKAVQSGVAAKDVIGPVDVSPGDHTVVFKTADWEVSSSVTVAGSQDVVVHWPADAGKQPVVTVFDNDVAPVPSDKGRLMVAHTAVVPPADITAGGKTLFTNIANGEFVSAEVPATTYNVAVVPTGGGKPLLGPVDLAIKAGALTRVFAIGAPRDGSMDAIVQVLPLETTSATGTPSSVDTGSAGFVRPDGSVDTARLIFWTRMLSLFGWLRGWSV